MIGEVAIASRECYVVCDFPLCTEVASCFAARDFMKVHPKRLFVAFILLLLGIPSCKDNGVSPLSGEWTVTITLASHDEFDRDIPLTGSNDVALTVGDQTLHAIIPQGQSSCSFTNLPKEEYYYVLVQKEGFFPANVRHPLGSVRSDTIIILIDLYQLPSPQARVDSIQCFRNTVVPQVWVRLFTGQTLPSGGYRTAVVFAGLGADVSARYGTYVFTLYWVDQAQGSSEILSDDFYRQLHYAGVASGTRVYVTARLTTGATFMTQDKATGVMIFSNLEENTHAVSSFIMP